MASTELHFTGPFTLKHGAAVFNAIASWERNVPGSCFGCHSKIKMDRQVPAMALLPLHVRPESETGASRIPTGNHEIARSITPPPRSPSAKTHIVAERSRWAVGHHRRGSAFARSPVSHPGMGGRQVRMMVR